MSQSIDAQESTVATAPRPPRAMRPLVVGVASPFCTVSLFFGLLAYVLSDVQEQRSQRQLYALFRGLIDPASPLAKPTGDLVGATPGRPR